MKKLRFVLQSILTMGSSPQSFLGARWLRLLLWITPKSRKRRIALWILGLSPHYFYRNANPSYEGMPQGEFLEAEFNRNALTRTKILDLILKPYLDRCDVVMDYGCGPGFLAKAVSAEVSKLYAVDLSLGVLACARVINHSENLEYVHLNALDSVPNETIDLVYSIAVIQHVTDDALNDILSIWRTKLKPGARVIAHVQLEDGKWKSEQDWRSDRSITGVVKFRYGLNCFARTKQDFETMLSSYGFTIHSIQTVASITADDFDDICHQHLIVAEKQI